MGAIVDENDTPHNDDDLLNWNFNGTATTSISGLNLDTQYTFNIYAYDAYGNKSYSDSVMFQTNNPPTVTINSAGQRTDGSGIIDIEIEVYDDNADDCQAKVEYKAGSDCDFSTSGDDPTLDETPANITSDKGTKPEIDNASVYQIGTSTRIITSGGANTVTFDWLSQIDIGDLDNTYCLQVTANDGSDINLTPATTTLIIDNLAPTAPGSLTATSVGGLSITLELGATTTENHFSEYEIYYKADALSGVTENDNQFTQYDDNNLSNKLFYGAESVEIDSLSQNTDYVFNIWVYDTYGNTASAAAEAATTTVEVPAATWREEEDTPDPTAGTPIGKETPVRLRAAVANAGDWTVNYALGLQYGMKNGSCAGISEWTAVPRTADGEHFEMIDSDYFNNMEPTSEKLSSSTYAFLPGFMIELPSATSSPLNLDGGDYSELEYVFQATATSTAGTAYCFRLTYNGLPIDNYDYYPELSLVPKPVGEFVDARQKNNGSGVVDIEIDVKDYDGDLSRARLDYAVGAECNFASPLDPTLDENSANISADYGLPIINNASTYQIGTSTGKIITQYGTNTVAFDWDSKSDANNAEDTYCLRLTVNDYFDDQDPAATTTITVDNLNPTTPGDLSIVSKTTNSVTLDLATASSDNHFFEYRIYYKEGSSGVSESNDLHSSSTDENLGFADFLGATTTTVYGLEENKQYVFKIWAYDEYGNSTSSVNEVNTKLVPSYFGTVYSDDGQTSLLTEPKVSMIVDGVFEKSVYASADDGSFEFVDVAPPATGTPVLIFLDDADEKGAAYNRYGGQGEINDFDIYQNHVIMRHDDDGPIATANVDAYDSDQDEDIICAVSGIDFNMASGYILYVWPGSTFEAGSGSMSFENIEIKGSFEAVGEQTITVSGGWDASSGSFDAASSTVEFTSTFAGNRIIANNNPFWSLTLNGAGGQWLFSGSATTSATTTIQAGILLHGADNHFEIGSLVIYDGASYQKATGTGKLIFEGRGFGIFEDNNSAPTNLGNVQIGYSPGRTNLNSDFAADSLTINASDSFYTRGYEVDITNDITIYGTYDCTDNKELDGTITTLGGDWLLDASAVFIADTSTTTFDGASDSSLSPGGTDASHDFNHLSLEKASTATTTINGGNLIIGGDLNIGANSIFDASSTNYDIYTSGGWTNQGKFIARQATTTFDAASAGHSIDAGDSAFYNLVFNSGSGGWTIAANATTSNNLAIASANSFIAASGTRIEVYGQFYNAVGAGNTTWNGSVLYLESGSEYAINAKNSGDLYGTLAVGPDTDINMWDSSANWYEIDNTGSLYSMDHGDNAGRLNIYGDYYVKEGESAYWSYATDFDGIDLSGSPRLCQVEIADGATTTVAEAGTLNILGSSAASTTISNQGSGNYALRVASGTLEADYFQIRNTNASGLNIYGSTTVDSLDHGDFELGVEGGSMITLTAGVININPYATSTGCRFATSTGISSGYNVALIGVPTDDWEFTGHYGNYDGDDFDNDPGDPRGYILWDDSIEYSPKSQAWQWFYDIEDKTPTSTPAAAATSSPSIGPGNTLKLRLTIAETGGLIGENSKMRLQYSTQPDFSSDAYWVGEIGSSTALWTYADGSQDYDNEVISQLILPDSSVVATHNESGISTTTYDHTADTAAEWEFTVFNNKAEDGVVYYFRAYSIYYFSIVNIYEKAVLPNTDESYPSLVVSSAALSMTISGVSDKTSIGEIETDFGTTATSVPFGELNPLSTVKEGAQRFTISTNAENGYQLFVYQRQNLVSESGAGINPISCTNEDPSSWSLSGNSGFGYHTTDVNLSNIGAGPSRFAPDNSYAKLEANIKEIGYSSIPVASDTFDLIYKLEITDLQAAGNYETDIVYILVPTF
ncbi:MAG: fibronectin type III domain-containing protein [Patescibacteria group bacterium]|nr:fibronectin type III domain-containing protein [Patescibacteria group bacterium]